MKIDLPILENKLVKLTPLTESDFEDLYLAASDPKIWEKHPAFDRYKRDVFRKFFDGAMNSIGAYVIWDNKTNKIIGSSRFNQIPDREDIVEIGWSFLATEYWGGVYNRAFKSLMIDFGLKKYTDILFYVDHENIVSQKAMTKLGATQFGPDGSNHIPAKESRHYIYVINRSNWP